jgi:hypothetical protein
VEPGEDVRLVDAMDGVIKVDLTKRIRVAELVPGEKVFAFGKLRSAPDSEGPRQGYRGTAEGYLLVSPPGRGMLLSTEPLARFFARKAAFHLRWAVIAAVAALAFNALFASFHARRWLGETVDVRVMQARYYADSDEVAHYEVTMRGADDVTFSDEVSLSDFQKLRAQLREGDRIQVRHVPSWRSATVIGSAATASFSACGAVPLLGVIALVYYIRARSTRAWYERKSLVEKGSGRLADSEATGQKTRKRAPSR